MNPREQSSEDMNTLHALRAHRQQHRRAEHGRTWQAHALAWPAPSLGQRVSDLVAAAVGSWGFILFQTFAIAIWIAYNAAARQPWDPYPFILLNLLLSFQAAYTAPAIMMSQNRQAQIDRHNAQNDFEINVKAELEIELLHQKIDLLKEREIHELTQAVRELSSRLEHRPEV